MHYMHYHRDGNQRTLSFCGRVQRLLIKLLSVVLLCCQDGMLLQQQFMPFSRPAPGCLSKRISRTKNRSYRYESQESCPFHVPVVWFAVAMIGKKVRGFDDMSCRMEAAISRYSQLIHKPQGME
jgi:hypothetical protein